MHLKKKRPLLDKGKNDHNPQGNRYPEESPVFLPTLSPGELRNCKLNLEMILKKPAI